jgi:hypothetical protein
MKVQDVVTNGTAKNPKPQDAPRRNGGMGIILQ